MSDAGEETDEAALNEFVTELATRIDEKVKLKHLNSEKEDLSQCGRLDSSIKKCAGFVRKLKELSQAQHESLLKDCASLNLSQYVAEIARTLTAECKIKNSDVSTLLRLCSLCHRRYPDFSIALLESWQKNSTYRRDDANPNLLKLRVDLRLLSELVAVGVFGEKEGLPLLAGQLKAMIAHDKDNSQLLFLPLILSFCKSAGYEYADLIPTKIRQAAGKNNVSLPLYPQAKPQFQEGCQRILKDYFTWALERYVAEHSDLRREEQANNRQLVTHGEIAQQRITAHEQATKDFQKLRINIEAMAELVGMEVPELREEEAAGVSEMNITVHSGRALVDVTADFYSQVFQDEEQYDFYRKLTDLTVLVPAIAFKNSEPVEEVAEVREEEEVDLAELELGEVEGAAGGREPELQPEVELEEEELEEPAGDAVDADGSGPREKFDAFLAALPLQGNTELIDSAAVSFVMYHNTKQNRKRLARSLFSVQRTRYDLLPVYARLVATLRPYMADVPAELNNMLRADFYYHIKKKDQIKIESKLKTVRFIGELLKFELFPVTDAVRCLATLLKEFHHHSIDMACALLDTAGLFLYLHPQAHHKLTLILDWMMRKKSKIALDPRYETMIDNAYFSTVPAETVETDVVVLPPWHQFVKYLIYKKLCKKDVESIIKQLRKLDWSKPEVLDVVTDVLSSCWLIAFHLLPCLANLLAGLCEYHELVGVRVVDAVVEDLRLACESPQPAAHQRRVAAARYLGELYNYRLADSQLVFRTLYSIIMHNTSLTSAHPLDPPEYLFRIHLVCVILDSCGQYFNSGPHLKKLDHFLAYFQRYYWWKRDRFGGDEEGVASQFPAAVTNHYLDCVEMLRPKRRLATSFEGAARCVADLEAAFADQVGVPEEEEEEDDRRLQRVEEGEDEEEEEEEEDSDESDTISANSDAEDEEGSQGGTGNRIEKCVEDDEFLSTLDRLLIDGSTGGRGDTTATDLPLPARVRVAAREEMENDDDSSGTIPFLLMSKKGNKQTLNTLVIPRDSSIVHSYMRQREAAAVEKEELKRMVMSITERQEESGANGPEPSVDFYCSQYREKRNYQPPKGVPDSEAIFGRSVKR